MKISVIIITYNQEKYIHQALEGLMIQRLDDNVKVEVIIADDFSTDRTPEILQQFAESRSEFDFVFFKTDTNLGHPQNYKRAFEACTGDYIAILEGDDYWTDPYRLQKHIDFLESHRECVMSFNRLILLEENKQEYHVQPWTISDEYQYINGQLLARGNCLGNLSACVIRKSAFDKIDSSIFELDVDDWLLGLSLSIYGLIVKLKEPMSVYRRHQNGQWSGKTEEQVRFKLLERIEIYNLFLKGVYKDDFDSLKSKLYTSAKRNYKIKEILPPLVFQFLRLLVPPIIVKKIYK